MHDSNPHYVSIHSVYRDIIFAPDMRAVALVVRYCLSWAMQCWTQRDLCACSLQCLAIQPTKHSQRPSRPYLCAFKSLRCNIDWLAYFGSCSHPGWQDGADADGDGHVYTLLRCLAKL